MQVKNVMTKDVECTSPTATLREVAQRMKDLDVGSMPVCHNDKLVGMVTDRDIAVRSVSAGHDPTTEHVRTIMSEGIACCGEDQDVSEAAAIMRDRQVRRLPVLDGEKRLVGIVSLGDLAVEVKDERLVGEALEGISEPPKR